MPDRLKLAYWPETCLLPGSFHLQNLEKSIYFSIFLPCSGINDISLSPRFRERLLQDAHHLTTYDPCSDLQKTNQANLDFLLESQVKVTRRRLTKAGHKSRFRDQMKSNQSALKTKPNQIKSRPPRNRRKSNQIMI